MAWVEVVFRATLRVRHALASIVVLMSLATAASAFDWSEPLDGDLSSNGLAPTALPLAPGNNLVSMTSGTGGGSIDRDYFRIRIPVGWELRSLVVVAADTIGLAFLGVQGGPQLTEPPAQANVANLLGWHHFSEADAGFDILPDIGEGDGAIGFVPPLSAGIYTWWVQEAGSAAAYTMRFEIAPVPEPSSLLLMASGAAAIALLGRKRSAAVRD